MVAHLRRLGELLQHALGQRCGVFRLRQFRLQDDELVATETATKSPSRTSA